MENKSNKKYEGLRIMFDRVWAKKYGHLSHYPKDIRDFFIQRDLENQIKNGVKPFTREAIDEYIEHLRRAEEEYYSKKKKKNEKLI